MSAGWDEGPAPDEADVVPEVDAVDAVDEPVDEQVDEQVDEVPGEAPEGFSDDSSEYPGDAPVADGPRTEVEPTGDPRVDEALERLRELDDVATAEHAPVYEEIHRTLQDALAEATAGAATQQGQQQGQQGQHGRGPVPGPRR